MANSYYDHTTFPQANSVGSSALMRAELLKIEEGFDKLIDPATHNNQLIYINSGGTAMVGSAALTFSGTTLTLNGTLAGTGLTIAGATLTTAILTAPAITGGTVAGATITGGTIADTSFSNVSVSSLSSPLPIGSGGTGASSAGSALTALGAMPIAGGAFTGGVTINTGGLAVTAGGISVGGATLAGAVYEGSAS